MNRMESFPRWLMVVGTALAFGAGYLASQGRPAGHRGSGDRFQTRLRPGSEIAAGESWGRKAFGGGSLPEVKERVRKRWDTSPAVTVDFELREETRRLMEEMAVADLEAWLRELRPIAQVDDDKDIPLQLREMILTVLAPRGGGTFVRALAEHPVEDGEMDVGEAMSYWIKKDPAAALGWLDGDVPPVVKEEIDIYREDAIEKLAVKDPLAALAWLAGDVPQEMKEDLDGCLERALVHLAGKDPAEFEKPLAVAAPKMRESVLESYAYRQATTDERTGILERAARSPHGEAMALWGGLLRAEGSEDPERAYATLAKLEISTTDRAILDERLVPGLMRGGYSFGDGSTGEDNGSEVMQGWVVRNPSALVHEEILDSFEKWSRRDAARAVAWVAGQPSGPQYDAFARSLIETRVGSQELDHSTAAGMASLIGDSAARGDAQQLLKNSWQAHDAAAADQWEKTLSGEDQERLQRRAAN
jgi:hypothetical protein